MTGASLALLDTSCSATALVCMTAGYVAVRERRYALHRNLMLTGVAASATFLAVFVFRVVRFGLHTAEMQGTRRGIAIAIMALHDGVAVTSIPLVLVAMGLGLSGDRKRHRDVAPIALMLWAWSASTGIVAWLVLYGPDWLG